MKPTDAPIVVEQLFALPASDVWNAITAKEHMQKWFFEQIESFEPTEGFKTQFDLEHAGTHYIHMWTITEVIPHQRIVYDWRYKDMPGVGCVTWELEPAGNETKLTLTNTAIEAFDDSDPSFTRESAQEGWRFLINERLMMYLTSDD